MFYHSLKRGLHKKSATKEGKFFCLENFFPFIENFSKQGGYVVCFFGRMHM